MTCRTLNSCHKIDSNMTSSVIEVDELQRGPEFSMSEHEHFPNLEIVAPKPLITSRREKSIEIDVDECASLDSVSVASSSFDPGSATSTKSVSFGKIEVRQYERIISDHPDVNVGAPIGLGWNYQQQQGMTVDDYQATSELKGLRKLSSVTRRRILLEDFGFSEADLKAAEKEAKKTKMQRRKTKEQREWAAKTEERVQSMKRKLGRAIPIKKGLIATVA